MQRDEIIEMAKEAGFWQDLSVYEGLGEHFKAFANLVAMRTLEGTYDEMIDIVRKNEREACAKFFDDNETLMFWGSQAATHIRARGEA